MCVGPHPFIPVPGVFKLALNYTLHGQQLANVMHVKSGGGVLTADADRISAVVANWWNTSARAQCSSQTALVKIVLDALDAEASLHKEYTTGWTAGGNSASPVQSSGVTACFKLSTGIRGRSYRGRFYWPGIKSDSINLNLSQLNAGSRDAYVASLTALRTGLTGDSAGDKLVIVSYCQDKAWLTTGIWTEVTGVSGHLQLDSMRRRLPGRGL